MQLATMIRNAELARLTQASQQRNAVLEDLAAHDASGPGNRDITPSMRVTAQHDRWRALRRAQLNTDLARETAVWSDARERAARALARADVLDKLAKSCRKKR